MALAAIGLPTAAAVESPITTACTPGSGWLTVCGSVASGSAPTRSSSVLTLRSTWGVLDAVSRTPPTFTAQTTTRPAMTVLAIFLYDCLRTPATAISPTAAKPIAMSVSHSK